MSRSVSALLPPYPRSDLAPSDAAPCSAVLLVGHGSRVESANRDFERLVRDFTRANPQLSVSYGYVELAKPSLESALNEAAERHSSVTLVPVFLFAAGHVKNDIPLALNRARSKYPQVEFSAAGPFGVNLGLVRLARKRLDAALGGASLPGTAVILAGRGSSDPDANAEFYKVTRLLAETGEFASVTPSFLGIASPSVEQTLELVARSRPERIIVVPYVLFAGRLTEKLQERLDKFAEGSPWTQVVLAGPLGNGPELNGVLAESALDAARGKRPLPCDSCQYRVSLSTVNDSVGGLKALLWSLRHSLTHTQAMPHEHAHAPMAKHVLVCGNADCADRGSIALLSRLRRLVKLAGKAQAIRVTRTHCMGRCGEGPTVAIYPDGVWYRGVKETDAEELVEEHLLNDRLVSRLVDNILQ